MTRWSPSYPIAFIIALLALVPVGVLIELGFSDAEFFNPRNLDILVNSLLLVALTALGAILVGVPLACLTAYVRLPWPRVWLILLAAPLALPSYLGAFTIYAAFGPGGEVEELLGIKTPSVYGLWGTVLVMVLYTYPFVMLTTRAALMGLDANQVHAARLLGLSLPQSLLKIVLPRVVNAMAAGSLLAGLYALSDFATPAMMRFDTFTRAIFIEYNAFGLSQAAMLSLQLILVVALVLFLESRVKKTSEKPGQSLVIQPRRRLLMLAFLGAAPVVFFALALPLIVFGIWLAREGLGGFDPIYAWNSVKASLLAAVCAVALAIPVTHAALSGRAGRLMERITYLGFGVPGIVMGTALVFIGLRLPFLYQTLALLVIAYVLRFLPLAVSSVRTTTEGLDSSLVSAARVLGATPREAFWRVTLPLTMRGMVAGAALVFLEAMRELPATLMLGPNEFETLATYLWRVYEAGYFGRAAIPGLILIVMSGLGLALMLSTERMAGVRIAKDSQK